ncbi:MAG: hypothetical protein OSB65_17640, partial [Roseibacillus sp.]|nr:hypothetical protein [Roseibacillus sp.]
MKAATVRRTFLRTSAATAVSVSAAATAKVPHERIKIGQLGTKHAHARGKLDTILKLSGLPGTSTGNPSSGWNSRRFTGELR